MHVGIATDHGGFGLKEELVAHLHAAGHEVVDFGAHGLNPGDIVYIVFPAGAIDADGQYQVLTVPDATHFTIGSATPGTNGTPISSRMPPSAPLTWSCCSTCLTGRR